VAQEKGVGTNIAGPDPHSECGSRPATLKLPSAISLK
jgi:hypothetical protein